MPIAEALLTRALGDLTMSALSIVFSGMADNDDRLELWSITLEGKSGEIVGILTNQQVEDLCQFLESAEIKPIFQAHFLGRLASEENCDVGNYSSELGQAFHKLAKRWCAVSAQNWSTLALDIWENITSQLSIIFPADQVLSVLTPNEIEAFREEIDVKAPVSGVRKGLPQFLRQILQMSGDLDQVTAVRDLIDDLKSQLAEYYNQIRLDHARHDFRIQIDKLYIERNLINVVSRQAINSEQIIADRYRHRLVVTGDPGIGKSTFTEYMIRKLSQERSGLVVPLVIQCRDYVAGRNETLIGMIRDKIASTLQLRVSEQQLESVLTLGWGIVIVDGVDEILDLGHRRSFIRGIEALGKRFPLCSIIVTSRNVGYTQAQFNSERFMRYELPSFTEEEIKEYAQLWFAITRRPESHLGKFLHELESIPDLRGNPLMLSLLCILYRDRGHIPRNRRQVYSQCADLLFNRWDTMRHIEQPYDHQHYGEELMQEIARWFYRSQAAQTGVEERQLQHVIAGFLRDTAAVPGSAATKRADDFLDFCADRAWLLGVSGTNERGQRMFVFTHRTFMEFFAAESLVRTLPISQIVTEVADTYSKDASSVLPDLIVQSAEIHRRGGAREIINGLLEQGGGLGKKHTDKFLPLCLRIINLSPVYPSLMDEIFERTLVNWSKTSPASSFESTARVLELYRDPRNRFMDMLRRDIEKIQGKSQSKNTEHPLVEFLIRWAHFYLDGSTALYDEEWRHFIDDVVPIVLPALLSRKNITLINFLVEAGYMPIPDRVDSGIVVPALGYWVPGYAYCSVERLLLGGSRPQDRTVLERLNSLAESGTQVPPGVANGLDTVGKVRSGRFPFGWSGIAGRGRAAKELKNVLLWFGCISFEGVGTVNPLHDVISKALKFNVNKFFSTREFFLDLCADDIDEDEERQYGTVLNEGQLEKAARNYCAWIRPWCIAEWSLVEKERESS